ncbi:hypothetical protein, partial [Streptomyces sp. P17]|uniref:hypothetical protein n=1 Tax=Streptomyces sp. P17 TaxID=3074716 RepID=UPI0028F40DB1
DGRFVLIRLELEGVSQHLPGDVLYLEIARGVARNAGEPRYLAFDAEQTKAIELLAAAKQASVSSERRRLYDETSDAITSAKQNFDKLVA